MTKAGLGVAYSRGGRSAVVEGPVRLHDSHRTYALTEQNDTYGWAVDRRAPYYEQQVHRNPDKVLAGIPRVLEGNTEAQQSGSSSLSSVVIQPTARSRCIIGRQRNAMIPKSKPIQTTPPEAEKERRELTHPSLRSGCETCVESKRSDNPHRQQGGADVEGLPVVGFDNACASLVEGRKDTEATFKTVYHRSSSMAAINHLKEVTGSLIHVIPEAIKEWGHTESVLRCQQEPAEIKLQREVIARRQYNKTIPQQPPRHAHGSLGGIERATQEIDIQLRTNHVVTVANLYMTQMELSTHGW